VHPDWQTTVPPKYGAGVVLLPFEVLAVELDQRAQHASAVFRRQNLELDGAARERINDWILRRLGSGVV
jgi:hypothetical protein